MKNFYLETFADKHRDWPLLVVPVADALNPFKEDKVEMYAVLGYSMPYETMKFLAVLGLLQDAKAKGMLEGVKTLIDGTSGAFGLVMAAIAPAEPFNIPKITLVMKEDVPHGKKYPPYLVGAHIIPPLEGLSPIATARKLGGGGWKPDGEWTMSPEGWLDLDQYANPANASFYRTWAAPRILAQVPQVTTLVVPVGTGGSVVGIGGGVREKLDGKVTVVGAMCAPGHEVPGVRDLMGMKEILLPWRDAIDERIEVETRVSYLSALHFAWHQGITPGVSSGLTYAAGLKFLRSEKEKGTLDRLRHKKSGIIKVVMIFHDNFRPYVADRFTVFLPLEWQRPSTAPMPWEIL
ncbi:pyridoxal-phosphate dependent enzyme [Patescibacteria group bacterium]|nr:pyridoxal-phosphate dependent enzyme [Patescibacteria group bacterium]MCL5114512.1 pyridoxal-phosphate dependent enzyme [Patescibacteria group bacterium]